MGPEPRKTESPQSAVDSSVLFDTLIGHYWWGCRSFVPLLRVRFGTEVLRVFTVQAHSAFPQPKMIIRSAQFSFLFRGAESSLRSTRMDDRSGRVIIHQDLREFQRYRNEK